MEGLVRIPVPPLDRNLLRPLDLNEGLFTNPEYWLNPIKAVLTKKKWKTNKVVVSLAPSFSVLRHFVMPELARKYWKQSIPLQARKYIHYPFEKGKYSFHVYPVETQITKQKKLGVVFAMTSSNIVSAINSGFSSIGYDVLGIELSSFSSARTYNMTDKEAVDGKGRVYTFFSQDTAELLFFSDNVPVLLRDLDISGPLPIERRRLEISNYIDFISKQLEKDPFEEVVLSGQNMDEWRPVLEADAKKPVRSWTMKEGLGFEPKNMGEICAIGACSKFVYTVLPDIDLSGKKRVTDTEVSALMTMWLVVLVAVLGFVGLNVMGKMDVQKAQESLRKEKRNVVTVEDLKGMSASDISSLADSVQSKKGTYDKIFNAYAATPLMLALSKVVNENIWVTKFSYKQDYTAKNSYGDPSLEIEGYVLSPSKEFRDDLEIGKQFRTDISDDPVFAKICKSKASSKGAVIDFPYENNSAQASSKGTRFILKCQGSK
ncbi:hypothetical protein Dip510_001270 [Elusimicrobium posterum]|uniref:type IV pilus biogenesis protein PilM n=1 Tax=Elusimicrobium posterum TaxID=3116653 RepID=UPI003C75F8D8